MTPLNPLYSIGEVVRHVPTHSRAALVGGEAAQVLAEAADVVQDLVDVGLGVGELALVLQRGRVRTSDVGLLTEPKLVPVHASLAHVATVEAGHGYKLGRVTN